MKKVQVIVSSIFFDVVKVHNVCQKKNGEYGLNITSTVYNSDKTFRTQIRKGDWVCVGDLKTGLRYEPKTKEDFEACRAAIVKALEG